MADRRSLSLGIDTGGTYTDAVLLARGEGKVVASAKALTTYTDLALGVSRAIEALPPFDPAAVDLVSLSTTLATNAIVEGRGRPVCLLLIGYDARRMRDYGFMADLVTDDVVFVAGGHDVQGNEQQPLDEKMVRRAALSRRDRVAAFAVSGYFSVRNPDHENRAKALIETATSLPVTCGHELSQGLNAVRRATTAALNARLIPLLRDLITAVKGTLERRGIAAPLMVVKGDGSLLAAEVALARPVETILSGPAASAVGAHYLAGVDDVVVVDMGGTTTDIAVLTEGRPRLNPEGARVGRWQTMVEAADVRTVGLGGDSHVYLNREERLQIGPRRVIPLSLLAAEHRGVLDELERQAAAKHLSAESGQFLCARGSIPPTDPAIAAALQEGPASLDRLVSEAEFAFVMRRRIEALESTGVVVRAAFTPTDALHVLGAFDRWSARAARLGATILSRNADCSAEELCQQIVAGMSERVAREVVAKAVGDAIGAAEWSGDGVASYLVDRAMGHHPNGSILNCDLQLERSLVAIGAPVAAYFPAAARHLHGELVIPPYADVANAVGAVAGSIVQRVTMLIRPLPDGRFRLHGPDQMEDFGTLESAADSATAQGRALAEQRALQAGAKQVRVRMERSDHTGISADRREKVFLGTEIVATAVGRATSR